MMWFRTKNNSVIALVPLLFMFLSGCFGEEEMEFLAPMEIKEKEALYSVVQGFVGTWWNGSDLYPDPCGWTPIQGISCDLYDGLWYVTALNIGPVHENSLGCAPKIEFRPQLFEFNHLKSLSFFNCFTSSRKHPVSIPTTNWDRLSASLESLEFRSNPGLVGPVPDSLGSLVKLQSLVLLENPLSGQLPDGIGNLVNLERLVLAGNRLTGEIPDVFGGLKKLLIFDLSRNSLSGPTPPSIGSLTSLLKLDLSSNSLGGNIPSEITAMKSLTLLDLSNNRFSGDLGLKSLGNLNSLEQMVLANNPIGGELKSLELQKLGHLAILDLSNTGLGGEIPGSIMALKRLRFLGLSDNNITGNLPPGLENLPSVGALYLNGNNLSGELRFSERFYGKMGRRFGAWDNPNLCYPIVLSQKPNHVPFGVKPCEPEHDKVKLIEQVSEPLLGSLNHKDSHLVASFGSLTTNGFDVSWWINVSLGLLLMFSFI